MHSTVSGASQIHHKGKPALSLLAPSQGPERVNFLWALVISVSPPSSLLCYEDQTSFLLQAADGFSAQWFTLQILNYSENIWPVPKAAAASSLSLPLTSQYKVKFFSAGGGSEYKVNLSEISMCWEIREPGKEEALVLLGFSRGGDPVCDTPSGVPKPGLN